MLILFLYIMKQLKFETNKLNPRKEEEKQK